MVDPHRNVLFLVSPGQIVYIGHFQFIKWEGIDSLIRIDYSQDKAAAEEALKAFPGISGIMITYDPRKPPQSVSR